MTEKIRVIDEIEPMYVSTDLKGNFTLVYKILKEHEEDDN